MTILDILLLAVGESMDASAVSMAKGTNTRQPSIRHYMNVGLWFGGFQAIMTLVGYFLGARFIAYVESFDHWISFLLLSYLGINMICDALRKDEEKVDPSYSVKTMLFLAIATSIDALAVGVSLGFTDVNVWFAASIIGIVTCILSIVGLKIGNIFGNRYKSAAEIIGGAVLVFIGARILFIHLM